MRLCAACDSPSIPCASEEPDRGAPFAVCSELQPCRAPCSHWSGTATCRTDGHVQHAQRVNICVDKQHYAHAVCCSSTRLVCDCDGVDATDPWHLAPPRCASARGATESTDCNRAALWLCGRACVRLQLGFTAILEVAPVPATKSPCERARACRRNAPALDWMLMRLATAATLSVDGGGASNI